MSCYSFTRWVNAFVNSIIQDTLSKSTTSGTLMCRHAGEFQENQGLTSTSAGNLGAVLHTNKTLISLYEL